MNINIYLLKKVCIPQWIHFLLWWFQLPPSLHIRIWEKNMKTIELSNSYLLHKTSINEMDGSVPLWLVPFRLVAGGLYPWALRSYWYFVSPRTEEPVNNHLRGLTEAEIVKGCRRWTFSKERYRVPQKRNSEKL